MAYVFSESGLSIDVMYGLAAFDFARQKSKLAGTTRGSSLVINGDH